MASIDLINDKLEAFETHMEDKLCALFVEFRLGRSPSPRRSQCGRSSDCKENQPEKEEQVTDPSYPCIRVDFPRREDRDMTGWISHAERYFCYHRTLEASMVNITIIHLGREAIQWCGWYKHTHKVPTRRQFKSGLLIFFRPTEYENTNSQSVKIRQASIVQEYQTRPWCAYYRYHEEASRRITDYDLKFMEPGLEDKADLKRADMLGPQLSRVPVD
ncbi:hypothetical protein GW17_00046562 [Ensete ventricosum]|nr:hypothetical protein GW17_00046562 [Ensete ventricosum]